MKILMGGPKIFLMGDPPLNKGHDCVSIPKKVRLGYFFLV